MLLCVCIGPERRHAQASLSASVQATTKPSLQLVLQKYRPLCVPSLLLQETLCSMAFADRASRAALGTESAQEVTTGDGLGGLWLRSTGKLQSLAFVLSELVICSRGS